jgi:hypothetical protein
MEPRFSACRPQRLLLWIVWRGLPVQHADRVLQGCSLVPVGVLFADAVDGREKTPSKKRVISEASAPRRAVNRVCFSCCVDLGVQVAEANVPAVVDRCRSRPNRPWGQDHAAPSAEAVSCAWLSVLHRPPVVVDARG